MKIFQTIITMLILSCLSFSALAKPTQIPVEVWADQLQISNVDMSPDAKRMAMMMRRERGGLPELMVFDTDDIKGTLQAIQPEGLIPRSLQWANKDYLIVNFYFQTEDKGRPITLSRTASYNVETKEWTSLIRTTTRRDIRNTGGNLMGRLGIGSVVNILANEPDYVLVSHREDRGKRPNYYKVNLKDGNRSLVLKGNSRYDDYIWDRDGNARGATEYDPSETAIVSLARMSSDDKWMEVGRVRASSRDRFDLLGFFNPQKPHIATVRSDVEGGNFMSIYNVDIRTGKRELVFQTEKYDAIGVLQSPRLADGTKVVGYTYSDQEGIQPYYTDETYGALYHGLKQAFPGRNIHLQRVSEDGTTALIYTRGPQDPGSWFLFKDGKVVPVISASTEIKSSALSPVEMITYKARDGLKVSGYVTLPNNIKKPFPTIVMPHGGPWVRDTYDYDRWAQMLANHGYAVFQPNYRGSTLLGKSFWLAGDKKWGHEMQNDIDDGMKVLVKSGIADPDKLAIFGWSYGGYAAFVAATRENNKYNCVVSGAGVSDLTQIRGGLNGSRFLRQFQKPTIEGVSPINMVDKVAVPMLVIHGDYDSTVPVEHSRRFVAGLQKGEVDYQYIEIEDMGHSPFFYEQNMQWFPQLFEFFDTKCGF